MLADSPALDAGIALLRVVLGLTMAAHGYKKFFGPGGIDGTAKWFGSIGMRPAKLNAIAAATTELVAGLLFAAGLLQPLASAAIVALMVVAYWTALRKNGFWVTASGWEYNLILAVAALALAATGAGEYSLDHALLDDAGFAAQLAGWCGLAIAAVVGLGGAIGQLLLCFRPSAVRTTPPTA